MNNKNEKARPARPLETKELNIGFAGNPNCGKTTLFNAYTGANLKVANWPGVTVEKKEGAMKYHNNTFKLIDLPGLYSLTSYTIEEKVARQFIIDDGVDVIINVVDASALERNLYLTLQLIELGKPVVIALNMMDIVEKCGMEIDLHRLPEMLGIPVVPVSGRKKRGLDILMHTVSHHAKKKQQGELEHEHKHFSKTHHKHDHHKEYTMVYSDEIEDRIDQIIEVLQVKYPDMENYRWHAIKLLENDPEIIEKYSVRMPNILNKSYEKEIINQKYDFIDEIIEEVVVNKNKKIKATDKIDNLLVNKFLGIPIFLAVMAVVFFLTFFIGDWLKEYFEIALDWVSSETANALGNINVSPVLISLTVEGVIAGVGGILTFLPNIFVLFLAMAVLEDSGYMSRVAYVMDGIMGKIGLSGKAFIPMILGFGCSVPAIMATRSLEDKNDRLKTIILIPFMSCSAKVPIYVMFSQMFFKEKAMLAAYSMYILGIVVGLAAALVIKFLGKIGGVAKIGGAKGEEADTANKDVDTGKMCLICKNKQCNPLLIELPEYKPPSVQTLFIFVWGKVKDYLTKAGTVIFISSIILWALLNLGPGGMVSDMGDSFGSVIGKCVVPVFKPIGLGYWQIVVAIIAGIAAKEVVVSSSSILFGINNISSDSGMASMYTALTAIGFGALNAYALMTFCLLFVPCLATIAVIKKETNSWKWTGFAVAFQISIAWLVTFIVYNIGKLLL